MTVLVRENLTQLLNKYNNLILQLPLLDYKQNHKKITQIKRFIKKSSAIVQLFKEFEESSKQIKELDTQIGCEQDDEFLDLLVVEKKEICQKHETTEQKIYQLLLDNHEYDNSVIIMEIRAAVGGDEASIFANDLYLMYMSYIEDKNWKTKIINLDSDSSHSLSFVQFEITGADVYNKLNFEAGIHRVQRVPTTEVRGRTHTSTVSVAILKKPKKINVVIDTSDLRIDRFRASAAGGQHVNKTDSAIRITHFPTGIVTASQDGRSQHENKQTALDLLKLKIYEREKNLIDQNLQKQRNIAIKHGERADKIRTYNYAQNRVTDHRIGVSWKNLDKIILGALDKVINSLTINHQAEQIKKIYEQNQ